MFNFNTAIHVLTCKSGSHWLTWKSYKNPFLFQIEHGRLYNFCRVMDQVSRAYCMCIIHPRSTIFGTHILTMSSINNIRCHSGKASTNGANLQICFSENSRFKVLMKNGTFLCKIRNFCTAGIKSYKNQFLFQKEHGWLYNFCMGNQQSQSGLLYEHHSS